MDFLLLQPPFCLSTEQQAAFESLIDSTNQGSFIDYQLNVPKWQFLSYLCKSRDLVLHGSQNLDIVEVEPRMANDLKAFSGQDAIYAATDGIWVTSSQETLSSHPSGSNGKESLHILTSSRRNSKKT